VLLLPPLAFQVVAKIKAETTPFEFVGDVGDVMLYHHCMVHSTGINTSDSIRMSCIQDFTREPLLIACARYRVASHLQC
jgi:ectoine hydroxylase-related dioxygenase (phytanoyl-CoA dioxygenase family)